MYEDEARACRPLRQPEAIATWPYIKTQQFGVVNTRNFNLQTIRTFLLVVLPRLSSSFARSLVYLKRYLLRPLIDEVTTPDG